MLADRKLPVTYPRECYAAPENGVKAQLRLITAQQTTYTSINLPCHIKPLRIVNEILRFCFFGPVVKLAEFSWYEVVIALASGLVFAFYCTFKRTVHC